MIAYVYQPDTKFFKTTHSCQKCPKTGTWLFPPNSTEVSIPYPAPFGKSWKYDGPEWKLVENYINVPIYNIEHKSMTVCQTESIPDGYTIQRPLDVPCTWNGNEWIIDIETYRANKINMVSQLSLIACAELFPSYKLTNIITGVAVYDEPYTIENYRALANKCRDEYYRCKTEIEKCSTQKSIDAIVSGAAFPTSIK